MAFIGNKSRYVTVYILNKNEAFRKFEDWKEMLEKLVEK